jgi:hypothetical protein
MSEQKMSTDNPLPKKRSRTENWTVGATEALIDEVAVWLERQTYLNWQEITKRYNKTTGENRCHTEAKARFERMYGSQPPKGTAATRERMKELCKSAEMLIRKAQKTNGGRELSDRSASTDCFNHQ